MGKVLVGYVSKTNSTREIAQRIGATLNNAGIDTDVLSLDTVRQPEHYTAVVLGSPIHAMRPLDNFSAFVKAHPEIAGRTAGLFFVTYIYDAGRGIFRRMMNGAIAKARLSTKARSLAVFGGRIPKAMPAPARLIFGLPRDFPLDIRDWDKIETWAATLASEIGS